MLISLSATTVLSHKAVAANGIVVPCDDLIGLSIGHSPIQRGYKLRIRESSIAQFGKPSTGKDSIAFGTMARHVENDFIGDARQPHSLSLTCKWHQLIQADQLHSGTFFHSCA